MMRRKQCTQPSKQPAIALPHAQSSPYFRQRGIVVSDATNALLDLLRVSTMPKRAFAHAQQVIKWGQHQGDILDWLIHDGKKHNPTRFISRWKQHGSIIQHDSSAMAAPSSRAPHNE